MTSTTQHPNKTAPGWGMIVFRTIVWIILMFLLLFIPAGTLHYPQGWGFLTAIILQMVLGLILFSKTPDLIKERIKPGPGTKPWDKVFMACFIPLFLAVLVVGSLDTGRFHWTHPLPWLAYLAGYLAFILSSALVYWSMWVNRFFSSVVRIQTDRGQTVIQSGPYRTIRHPGYLGGIVWLLASALILGSLRALIPAALATLLLIIRTALEDRTLQHELPGYPDYTHRVRYKLFPKIW